MASIDYEMKLNTGAKAAAATVPLKLFGFSISDDHQLNLSKSPIARNDDGISISDVSSSSTDHLQHRNDVVGQQKYECQYCGREFTNSQALGGHQNAHKKERQLLKRAQIHATNTRNLALAGPTAHNHTMISPFISPPPHSLGSAAAAQRYSTSSPWFYMTSPHSVPAYGGGAFLTSPADHGRRVYDRETTAFRGLTSEHSGVLEGLGYRNCMNNGEATSHRSSVDGLDLHLSLGPASP